MDISVIIPTYNESDFIAKTIKIICERSVTHIHKIIVVDGGSTDRTVQKAEMAGARVLEAPRKGRAAQMNYAAERARGDVLYFIHADTQPPQQFDQSIQEAVNTGYEAGCFRLSFDDPHAGLQFYALFTRVNINVFRFGDQSLFIKRAVFNELKGFREDHQVMEDQEMVQRIHKRFSFILLDDTVTTSARKYRRNGVLRLQLVYTLIFCLYYLGLPQQKLVAIYKRLTKQIPPKTKIDT